MDILEVLPYSKNIVRFIQLNFLGSMIHLRSPIVAGVKTIRPGLLLHQVNEAMGKSGVINIVSPDLRS